MQHCTDKPQLKSKTRVSLVRKEEKEREKEKEAEKEQ
jgi:hypothetical protein